MDTRRDIATILTYMNKRARTMTPHVNDLKARFCWPAKTEDLFKKVSDFPTPQNQKQANLH